MSRQTYDCKYPGCNSKTVYPDGLCRIHRRVQVGNHKNNMASLSEGLLRPHSSTLARNIISTGRAMVAARPIVIHSREHHAYAITKFVRQDDPRVPEFRKQAESLGGSLGVDGGEYHSLVIPDSGQASLQQTQNLADRIYATDTFQTVAGSDPSKVEQYDDPGEAIIHLNIPARRSPDISMVYMNAANGEKVRLHSGPVNIIASIDRDDHLTENPDGSVFQGYHYTIESFHNGPDKLNHTTDVNDTVRGTLEDICEVRATLERYKFQVDGHEGTSGFFVPSGWTDNPIR